MYLKLSVGPEKHLNINWDNITNNIYMLFK